MKLLQPLFRLQLPQIPKWVPIVILVLALAGFADATYLTVKHYQNIVPPCAIDGCETVLTSPYSEILGLPVSLLGSIFYLIILISLFVYFDIKNSFVKDICIKLIMAMSAIGLLASLYFISLMLFVIHAICIYCMISDIITILIAIFAFHIIFLSLKFK